MTIETESETLRQMREIANELGYPSILEALEALQHKEEAERERDRYRNFIEEIAGYRNFIEEIAGCCIPGLPDEAIRQDEQP